MTDPNEAGHPPEDAPRRSGRQDRGSPDHSATAVLSPDDLPAEPDWEAVQPPVSGWDRYDFEGFLGAGGMGRVFRARDRRLDRAVAIKFLGVDRPELVRRFLREAQAQARVEHPHVCKVYEVGEVDGRPFIAMQLIGGRSLEDLLPELNLEERLAIVRSVAEAVHAAHRTGLIHRDLKPANIMVEWRDEAGWWPYVVDFGLARDLGGESLTMTGVAMGTPAYMAPEQAAGDPARLDRRCDVYSLGATLYALVAGQPPFRGTTPVEVLVQVLNQEPPPLRAVVPDAPRDLESLVMKCLEREPERRYESARALAEDLGRFLDGEPVLARPHTLLYRLATRARKHRGLVAAGMLAAVLVLGLASLWIGERVRAGRQAELAQRFGQEAERIESELRLARMAPAHDIAPDRARLRARLDWIRAEMKRLGQVARGPGLLALGRGNLALGQLDEARTMLDRAWTEGFETPAVATARGLTLARLYQREAGALTTIADSEVRVARRRQIESELRDPARELLRSNSGLEPGAPGYLEALLAYLEGDHSQALQLVQQAVAPAPWSWDHLVLEGEILAQLAQSQRDRGELELSEASLGRAADAYGRALTIARSDAGAQVELCLLGTNRLSLEVDGRGQDPRPLLDTVLQWCEAASELDSENAGALMGTAVAHRNLAIYLVDLGQDPAEPLRRARAAAARAVEMSPGDPMARLHLGNVILSQANHLRNLRADPATVLGDAIAAFEEGLRLSPANIALLNALGMAHHDLGSHKLEQGVDPSADLTRAEECFRRTLEIRPDFAFGVNNMGIVATERTRWAANNGQDPTRWVDEALRWYDRASELNPVFAAPVVNTGITLTALAEFQGNHDVDPRPVVEKAVAHCRHALELKPSQTVAYHSMALALFHAATWEAAHGIDARSSFSRSITAFVTLRDLAPTFANVNLQLGRAYAELGKLELQLEHDGDASLDAAANAYLAQLEQTPGDPVILNNLGDLAIYRARADLAGGRDPRPHLDSAVTWLEQARTAAPSWAFPLFNLAFAFRTEADDALRRGRDPTRAVARADEAFRAAVELQPGIAETYAEIGAAWLTQAEYLSGRGQTAGQALDTARTHLAEAGRYNPNLPGLGALTRRAEKLAASLDR